MSTDNEQKGQELDARYKLTNLGDGKAAYARKESQHRNWIKPNSRFSPEAGRYHLHIALACPWACGVLSMLYLKGLDHAISFSVVHPTWQPTKPDTDAHAGWIYRAPGDDPILHPSGNTSYPCDEACIPDTETNVESIRALYELDGDMKGPFTTPVLWDKKENTIVNNESMEILQILNSGFPGIANDADFYPPEHEAELKQLNDTVIYNCINNGVYRCGFARSQDAYNTAVTELFAALDQMETRLSNTRYLTGNKFTWLDLRLFHTLVRFDPVYTCYFKTNHARLADYPNLLGFVRDIYSNEAVARTINMAHIKAHYYTSHPTLNRFGIIPIHDGPDLTAPHGRADR